MRGRISTFLVFVGVACLAGCREEQDISAYTVPKKLPVSPIAPPPSDEEQIPNRMLAAMLPNAEKDWFFKLQGDPAAVEKVTGAFREFLKSVRLPDSKKPPTWKLPAGWTEVSGVGQRQATLLIGGGELSVAVTGFTRPDGQGDDTLIAMNVNRWRGQLGLPPVSASAAADQAEMVDAAGRTLLFLNLVGIKQPDMMGAPFASGRPMAAANAAPPAEPPVSKPVFDVPPQWTPGTLNTVRKAAYDIRQGDLRGEVAVSDMRPGIDLVMMVNEWRAAVGAAGDALTALPPETKKIESRYGQAAYFEIAGERNGVQQTILAAVVTTPDRVWFIKLRGDTQLVGAEKAHFEAFVKSMRVEP